jgi:glycerophosphoryl diester phosphodiesterase
MGIRPEHLDIGSEGWEARVETVELLGAERLVYARVGGEQIIVRTEEQHIAPAPDSTIRVKPRETACTGSTRNPASGPDVQPWPYPRWIAHRGAGKLAPENTLAAFRLGAQHGYRMAECDAKLSADDVVFLLHDATLERTTSGRGTAGDLPWNDLSQLDAGSWHSRQWAGEPLPTLAQLAALLPREPAVAEHRDQADARHRGANRRAGGGGSGPLVGCPRGAAAPDVVPGRRPDGARRAAPHLPRGLLLDTWTTAGSTPPARSTASAIVCNQNLWDAAAVQQVQGAGMRCLSYTVNDPWSAERLLQLGTDGIITDRVDLFPPASASAGRRQRGQRLRRDGGVRRVVGVVAAQLDRGAGLDGLHLRRRELEAHEVHGRGLLVVLAVQVLVGDGVHAGVAFHLDEHAVLDADQPAQLAPALVDVGVLQQHGGLPVGAVRHQRAHRPRSPEWMPSSSKIFSMRSISCTW